LVISRPLLLGGAAVAAVAAGLFVAFGRGDADAAWYGFALDEPISEVSGAKVRPRSAMQNFTSAAVFGPPAPWTEADLASDSGSDRIRTITLVDEGVDAECPAAPCPVRLLKPAETFRAEAERVKADLMDRLGAPTETYGGGGETTYVWDFEKPGSECHDGRLRPRVLKGDSTGKVGKVQLSMSWGQVMLMVSARAGLWRSSPDPSGAPPAPPLPPAPGPPTPACS
jgi:hypothetical protein